MRKSLVLLACVISAAMCSAAIGIKLNTLAYVPALVAAIFSGTLFTWLVIPLISVPLLTLSRNALNRHQIGVADIISSSLSELFKVPFIGAHLLRAPFAVEVARVRFIQGKEAEARIWADRAVKYMNKVPKGECETQSRIGWLLFDLGEIDRAQKMLHQARIQFSKELNNREWFAADNSFCQAVNYDLLAKLELQAGNREKAEEYFKRSIDLRIDTTILNASAEAYAENSQAILRWYSASNEEAENHALSAAKLLPPVLLREQDRLVALDVIRNLERLNSDEATGVLKELSSRTRSALQAMRAID